LVERSHHNTTKTQHPLLRFFPLDRIIYLSPGQSCELAGRKDGKARVRVSEHSGVWGI